MIKESEILFEIGKYWACKSKKLTGYEIYLTGVTHSTKVAHVGFDGQIGLDKTLAEINRRIALEQAVKNINFRIHGI